MKSEIKIFQNKIRVKFEKENVWLNQLQISQLFETDRTSITKHILNIFSTKELPTKSNVQFLHIAGSDKPTKHYSLDLILSVGYRVNSKKATQFRIWATKTLKKYLLRGYVVNQQRLDQLQTTIRFFKNSSTNQLLSGHEKELFDLLSNYTDSLILLKNYDENKIILPKLTTSSIENTISIDESRSIINNLKQIKSINSNFFGIEYPHKLESIIGVINQTHNQKELYSSVQEKAANLLYLIIKDHPFIDGNKRIASVLFVRYLQKNKILYKPNGEMKINDMGIVSLALLVATSNQNDKNILINLIINLIK